MNSDSIIILCSSCGTKNRIPEKRIYDHPICGKCRAPLSKDLELDHPVIVTDRSFQEEIISYPGPVLLDCWAPWCGPCKAIAPVLEQLAKEYKGRIKIAKLNVDENPEIASRYAIQSIPTMLLFQNGKTVNTLVGALPKHEIEKHVKSII